MDKYSIYFFFLLFFGCSVFLRLTIIMQESYMEIADQHWIIIQSDDVPIW